MPQPITAKQKANLYGLVGLGFAGLIGARVWATQAPDSASPFLLAALGTLCFVAAGLTAYKLMR
jgi:hypothetical protein